MNKCDQNCNTCSANCKKGCPICNVLGKNVPLITVKSLIKDQNSFLNDKNTYICINRKFNIVQNLIVFLERRMYIFTSLLNDR